MFSGEFCETSKNIFFIEHHHLQLRKKMFSQKEKQKNNSKTLLGEKKPCLFIMILSFRFSLFLHCTSGCVSLHNKKIIVVKDSEDFKTA